MNALSTPSHFPTRQPSARRNSSEIQTEEDQRSARLEMLQQQVRDTPWLPSAPAPVACDYSYFAQGSHLMRASVCMCCDDRVRKVSTSLGSYMI